MKKIASLVAVATLSMGSASAFAATTGCSLSHDDAQDALNAAVIVGSGQFDLDMWITIVNRDGAVCAVAKANGAIGGGAGLTPETADPWPGSRAISAQKANTANSYSNTINSFTTANLWAATQPGGSLFGLQESNPVDPRVGYRGDSAKYGTANDPMNGLKVGGVNVFGGGIALYNSDGEVIGALGVSGDTSCADHNIAWSAMEALDGIGGVSSATSILKIKVADAGIVYDVTNPYGHPSCDTAASTHTPPTDWPDSEAGSDLGLGNINLEDGVTSVIDKSETLGAGYEPATAYAP